MERSIAVSAGVAGSTQLYSSERRLPPRTPPGAGWHHRHMDWTLEVVLLPVSDIDRSVAFYRDQVGFNLDHDTTNEHMHVVQLTPRGSGCSIVIGDLPAQREMAPGSMRGLQLVVADAQAARAELLSRGVGVSEIQKFDERDGGTFFGFADPDGNTWSVQELKVRAETPLIPVEHRGHFGA
jgi:predicted enzyme related to lactoylglutathione lyase